MTTGQSIVTLYDPANGPPFTGVIFPITPAQVKATSAAVLYSFTESRLGAISRPRGTREAQYTMSCRLPGQQRSSYTHVHDWQPPLQILQQLDAWARSSIVSQRTRLTLSVPDQGICQDVYIGQFDYTFKGGQGDAFLSLNLTEFRSLAVDLASAATPASSDTLTASASTTATTTTSDPGDAPDAGPDTLTYAVQPGDSLWEIAQTRLGDGSLWQTLYQANVDALYQADVANGLLTQDPSHPDPALLFAGTVLVLPSAPA